MTRIMSTACQLIAQVLRTAELTVDLVEPASVQDEAQRIEHDDGQNVERELVAEHSITLDALDGCDSLAEHGLGGGILTDYRERITKNRHGHSQEQCVRQEGVADHQKWAEDRMDGS